MKTPNIKECPCCGVPLMTSEKWESTVNPTVEPRCEQHNRGDGEAHSWRLFWRCLRCGCQWLHGQFEKKGE